MIHLDTNYLIGLLVRGSAPAAHVEKWLAADLPLAVSAVVWSEFLNGPVTQVEIDRVAAVIQSRVVPFGPTEAALAAKLFNKTGRRRGSRFDCFIAAAAITAPADLATVNAGDFKAFVPHGLKLV